MREYDRFWVYHQMTTDSYKKTIEKDSRLNILDKIFDFTYIPFETYQYLKELYKGDGDCCPQRTTIIIGEGDMSHIQTLSVIETARSSIIHIFRRSSSQSFQILTDSKADLHDSTNQFDTQAGSLQDKGAMRS